MSIYSNDNIRKIAKLTTRELPQKSKNAKIMAYIQYTCACVVTDRCFVKDGDKSDTLEIVEVDSNCDRFFRSLSLHCSRPYNRKFYLHVFHIDL